MFDFMINSKIFKKSSSGKLLEWSANVECDESGKVFQIISFGQVGGKIQVKKKEIKEGTNVGKSNERNPFQQACFEVEVLYSDRMKHNWSYDPNTENKEDDLFPMLAAKYDEKTQNKKWFSFPVIVQPKLNGVRCVSYRHTSDDTMWSRNRKEYAAIESIKQEIDGLFGENSPDGEVYIHGELFENIISWVKKKQPDTEKLEYYVYDLAIPFVDALSRQRMLDSILDGYEGRVKRVPYYIANSHDEIKAYHDEFTSEGYEGIIIRNMEGEYQFGKRANVLLKYKDFQDEEFKIVGYDVEVYHDSITGAFSNLVVWECETASGGKFNVRPRGTYTERAKSYTEADSSVGKYLTVRFQNLSKDGIPIFPIGLCLRDYE